MIKIRDVYDFKCEVVHHQNKDPLIITHYLYRSEYIEFYKGTKTTKCEFTIVEYGNKYSCFVFAKDEDKKRGNTEFRGNLLWGFGKPLTEMDMIGKLSSYTNMDDVKKDFGL